MKIRKVCIITGSRAEWGLFYPLASEIKKHKKDFMLQVMASGSHTSSNFGLTYREIEKDGFEIDWKVRMPLAKDTEEAIAASVSTGIKECAKGLKRLKPDLVILLGDRFETFAAAVACLFCRIPVAHLHGGELTEGSMDDALRHSITKMSYLHFVSTNVYRDRVIQLGEEPSRVFNVGALASDNIKNTRLLSRREFEKRTGFKLGCRNVMVTYNPSTFESKISIEKQFKNLLSVIDRQKDTKIMFTKPNPDIYSKTIIQLIDSYVSKNKKKCSSFISMGRILYLSALQFVDLVAGNSSSGIIEAPSFYIPTVNIGDRQKGRVRAKSVIDVKGDVESIKRAFKRAFSPDFRRLCKRAKNPYGRDNPAKEIVNILKKVDIGSIQKRFFDLDLSSKK